MYLLLLLALFQSPPADPALRSGCSMDDEELTRLRPDDAFQVEQALGGGDQTCYKLKVTRNGKDVTGYVLGDASPAIAGFIHEREKIEKESFEAQARQAAAEAAAAAAAAKPKPVAGDQSQTADQPVTEVFENFSARDINGKAISLSGIGGRVVLITFWSPRNRASARELISEQPLYNQFKSRGFRAIGVSADPKVSDIFDALDDARLTFPLVPDRYGLTKRYKTNGKTATTLLLDASHHIVATGLTGPALEQKIRELLAAE